ncbi:hypothetical protein P8891_06130 [Bacillus atrophaeus]|uniref:hypothetical protein n=1 Tax=Bacillus atrophaeus TaxID=1452 RepID=UPI00227E3635|nr:hypothetical protein [Bacillus atrophaeus]MCY7948043.1 hypothetical protein [Bacillus atrophaeus]MCY8098012.1 hypothetical protein [Bacillus atrophaeus]MCY9169936.1 hypothetical protein [Bacillus atrophaeus]MEC0740661.1 hypothetical protein [Bacillus atrophaeus]MEC0747075.1 hypothetical protein [Bacillus atrophaeus]
MANKQSKSRKTLRQKVESILAQSERARNNDRYLLYYYWKHYDKVNFKNFATEFIRKATSAESITRMRRMIQDEGKFLPTDEVQTLRRSREREMRKAVKRRDVI